MVSFPNQDSFCFLPLFFSASSFFILLISFSFSIFCVFFLLPVLFLLLCSSRSLPLSPLQYSFPFSSSSFYVWLNLMFQVFDREEKKEQENPFWALFSFVIFRLSFLLHNCFLPSWFLSLLLLYWPTRWILLSDIPLYHVLGTYCTDCTHCNHRRWPSSKTLVYRSHYSWTQTQSRMVPLLVWKA